MASVRYDTILSNFEGKLTLMQWLKACDASLKTLTEDFSDLSDQLTRTEERVVFVESETDALRGITTNLDTRVTALENAPAPSSGTQLYKHVITVESADASVYLIFFVVSTREAQYAYLSDVVNDFKAGKITFGYLDDNYGHILSIKNDAGTYRFVTLAYAFDDYSTSTEIQNVAYDFDSHSVGSFNDSVTAL